MGKSFFSSAEPGEDENITHSCQLGFENLEVWKKSIDLCVDLFKSSRSFPDRGFREHITKTAMSVPSNIAEGYERSSKKESVRFFSIAKGSCGELRTQIIIGVRAGLIDPQNGSHWIESTREISSMLVGLIKSRNSKVE